MVFRKTFPAASLAIFLLASGPASAHHSIGVFDINTPIWVKGTVVSVEFVNPHPFIYLDQETADGQVLRWIIESSPTMAALAKRGFTKDTLKKGDKIEACGYAPKKRAVPAGVAGERVNPDAGSPGRPYPDRVITGRMLILPDGPDFHWSHYGPLEKCINLQEYAAKRDQE